MIECAVSALRRYSDLTDELVAKASKAFQMMEAKVQVIIKIMEDNLHENLTLDELAQCVNLTPSHLCYLFKTHKGTSPMRFLKTRRLEKTCELLEKTLMSIKEISFQVGIKDESHFMRDFKKFYGVTPSQYRAENLSFEKVKYHNKWQNQKNGQ